MSPTTVSISYPTASSLISFGAESLRDELRERGVSVTLSDVSDRDDATGDVAAVVVSQTTTESPVTVGGIDLAPSGAVEEEGFEISTYEMDDRTVLVVTALDETGAMYGALELAERVRRGTWEDGVETLVNPAVSFRAVKFNLPWSPYRGGDQTDVHLDTCRDLSFWRRFLDMMAENRFNVLSLWNLHPFPFMVRAENYPEACPFTDEELARWQDFWRSLFRMADERGIDTYIVNWNIVVSPSFAEAYDVDERNDHADVVREYTRESITQVINEYPNLTGIGVSLCDWMKGMSPEEKQEWFEDTFIEGMRRANRPTNLLDRSVLTESIEAMRRAIDVAAEEDNVGDIYVPTKFNWSHGHSTTSLELTHDYASGTVDDRLWNPEPTNYEIAWMIRNEDFFVLRWGDPDFVREHVAKNHADNAYVGGYFVGSEAYIPAMDFSHRHHKHRTWQYAFEKQWLFYTIWGRLLYDPETPDEVFEAAFERRYGPGTGEALLTGIRNGSQMALELASFHASTWDYTLLSEGFLSPEASAAALDEQRGQITRPEEPFGVRDDTQFITIDELIYHETLDPRYLSIPEYVALNARDDVPDDAVSPLDLADRLTDSGESALAAVESIRPGAPTYPGALECELADIETWGHLSLYVAAKLRGGVALETFRQHGDEDEKLQAVSTLEAAAERWADVVECTEPHYREIPYATDWKEGNTFSWAKYMPDVERDVRVAEQAEYEGAE